MPYIEYAIDNNFNHANLFQHASRAIFVSFPFTHFLLLLFSTLRFMDAQILKLAKQTNRQGLVDFLDSKSLDQVGNRAYKKRRGTSIDTSSRYYRFRNWSSLN